MDDPESPTLRISYARALNNPKVKDGRANATEDPSARAADQRRGPQPDAYGAHRQSRGPSEQVGIAYAWCCSVFKDVIPYSDGTSAVKTLCMRCGRYAHPRSVLQAPFRGEPNGTPLDPRHDMRGRATPRDAGPGRRAVPHQRADMATPSGELSLLWTTIAVG